MDTITREIQFSHFWMSAIPAVVFVLVMSLVREPARQRLNSVLAGGLASLYVNGGLGLWEFVYMGLATIPAYLGLRSYRFIGVAWLMHTGWDLVHHFYANAIWHWAEMSSFGYAVMNALVAVWFFAGAPSVYALLPSQTATAEDASMMTDHHTI